MTTALPYIQIVLSVLLVGGILLQRSEAGLGSAFGADGMTSGRYTRRGFEKTLFRATILIAVLFGVTAFASLFVAR
jgi:protein translocase SecG subunit